MDIDINVYPVSFFWCVHVWMGVCNLPIQKSNFLQITQQTSARRSSQIRRSAIAFKLIRCEVLLLANLIRQFTQSMKQSPTTWSKCSKMTVKCPCVRYTTNAIVDLDLDCNDTDKENYSYPAQHFQMHYQQLIPFHHLQKL